MEHYYLENANGLKLKLTNYGGIVMEIHVPDRDGNLADVTLGFDTVEAYQNRNDVYFGALIGRFGNRIARGRFSLDGVEYDELAANDGPHHLHGGRRGFDKVAWLALPVSGSGYTGMQLTYRSPDGEEGYPGNLDITATYKLTDNDEWIIEYEAKSDAPTVVNPTNHAYFNLSGHDGPLPLSHLVQLNSKLYTAADEAGIPTGEILSVEETDMDFRVAKTIASCVDSKQEVVKSRGGFDHNFVIDKKPGELGLAAVVYEPVSGREMKVYTTEPGIQFYSGNFLDGSLRGKGGHCYAYRSGFCLETQRFPDSPNHGHFPDTTLRPGVVFRSKTIYAFSTR